MYIYLTRHGQTNFNKARLMQGQINEPLNDTGREQARAMRKILLEKHPGIRFDAVFSSPLDRAVETAMIIGDVPREQVFTDERIIETSFGRYEKAHYHRMGVRMTLYWAYPELFKAPPTVESTGSMIARSQSFLKELEHMNYECVLVAAHGGILRTLSGYLDDRKNGLYWRPKPRNCEIRVYESENGRHRAVEDLLLDR